MREKECKRRPAAQPNYKWSVPLSGCIVIKTNKNYKIKNVCIHVLINQLNMLI